MRSEAKYEKKKRMQAKNLSAVTKTVRTLRSMTATLKENDELDLENPEK